MNKFSKCKQCGKELPIESFRKYYNGSNNHYKYCKTCEQLNTKEKNLRRKKANKGLNDEQEKELTSIYKLWDAQRALGLKPPKIKSSSQKISELIVSELETMTNKYLKVQELNKTYGYKVPYDLCLWLIDDLVNEPDYYLNNVYDNLVDTYKPVKCISDETHLPVYDDTHAAVLSDILDRFYKYDDDYDYESEDDNGDDSNDTADNTSSTSAADDASKDDGIQL